jgi:hypothetical protein
MKKLLLIIYVALISVTGHTSTNIPAGNIYGNWTLAGSPYYVKGDVIIPDDSVLNVAAGVTVRIDSGRTITVYGTIRAIGNSSQRIRFSVNDSTSDGIKSIKGWHGFRFSNAGSIFNNDTSILKYCIIEHSKYTLVQVLSFNKLIVERCILRKGYTPTNGGAFNIQGSSIKVINNVIYDNYTDYGASVQLYQANSYFSGNIISNNRATSGGAGVYMQENSNSSFFDDIICNNTCVNCTTASDGAGVNIISSTPEFYNCDIVNNFSNKRCGGVMLSDNSDANFYNCIIYGNTSTSSPDSNVFLYDNYSDPNFYNCDIKGGKTAFMKRNAGVTYNGIYSNNLNVLPNFNGASAGAGYSFNGTTADWSLFSRSELINKGKPGTETRLPSLDFYGKKRLFYGILDIGVAEYNRSVLNITSDISTSDIWYADTVKLMWATDSITITDGTVITVPPGVIVKSRYNFPLLIKGALIAIGTPTDRIKFTYYDTTGFTRNRTSTGYTTWKGIWIMNPVDGSMFNNDTTKFIYCDIEYVKNQGNKTYDGGIFVNNYQGVIVQYSRIMHNTGRTRSGIVLEGNSDILVDHNEIFDNIITYTTGYGAGIYVSTSDPVISNNKIYNNSGCEKGSGVYLTRSNGKLFNNIITNNTSNTSGGGLYLDDCDLAMIYNNVIQNNRALSGSGGGIYIDGNLKYFFNNTVAYNRSSSSGGGIITYGNYLNINNSIVYGNTPNQMYLGSNLSTLNIYNSDFQGGLDAFGHYYDLTNYGINYLNNIDVSPDFISPPGGSGTGYNGLTSSLDLKCISYCINAGTNTIDGVVLPDYDIAGRNRIQVDTVDMGAYEVTESQVKIISQPVGKILCKGEYISLSVTTKDVVRYQWQKDGADISGATGYKYIISSAIEGNEGNYTCIVHNAFSQALSSPAFVKVQIAPELTDQPVSALITKNSPLTLLAKADGTKPMHHTWYRDGIELPDTIFKIYIDSFRSENEGTYLCDISNSCGTVSTQPAIFNLVPSICMVTVFGADKNHTGNNRIVWDKESTVPYAKYNVYRESTVAGYYDKIGEVPSSDPGVFDDTVVNPKEQAYLYKITAVNSSDEETDISAGQLHKTIHLLVTKGEQGGIQLDWDQYIGFPYSTYYIFRSDDEGKTFEKVHVMSSSTRTWTDDTIVGPTDVLYYYVSVGKTGGCNPEGTKKGGSDIYSQSVSNMEDNRLKSSGITKLEDNGFNFSFGPNPVKQIATINYTLRTASPVTIELYNTMGSRVTLITNNDLQAGPHQYELNVRKLNLSSGVYILKFNANHKTLERMLVVTK